MKRLLFSLGIFFAGFAWGANQIDPLHLPASGFQGTVGVEGGIPSYQLFVNIVTGEVGPGISPYGGALAVPNGEGGNDCAPAILAAVLACPDGRYVYCPAGQYRLGQTIVRNGGNPGSQLPFSVQIKGAGPSLTKLYYYGTGDGIVFQSNGGPFARNLTINSGLTRGSTQVIVAALDQFFQEGVSYPIVISNADSGAIHAASYYPNARTQIVKVTHIDTGTKQVTFEPALNADMPGGFFTVAISHPYRCGVTDLYFKMAVDNFGHSIILADADESFIDNVELDMASHWHIKLQRCYRPEVRHSYLHDGYRNYSDSTYGVGVFAWTCNGLYEDNIGLHLRHMLITEYGCQGNVFGYNFDLDPENEGFGATDYLMGDMITHSESTFNLWEGNVAATIRFDCVGGANLCNTAFKNNVTRKSVPSVFLAQWASDIQKWNYNNNLVGNYNEPPGNAFPEFRRWGTNQDGVSRSITAATNTNPVVLTAGDFYANFQDGDYMSIAGATGNTAINVTQVQGTHTSGADFSIPVAGNGTYTGNGIISTGFDPQSQATTLINGENDVQNNTITWLNGDHDLTKSLYIASWPPAFWDGGPTPTINDTITATNRNPAWRRYHAVPSITGNISVTTSLTTTTLHLP